MIWSPCLASPPPRWCAPLTSAPRGSRTPNLLIRSNQALNRVLTGYDAGRGRAEGAESSALERNSAPKLDQSVASVEGGLEHPEYRASRALGHLIHLVPMVASNVGARFRNPVSGWGPYTISLRSRTARSTSTEAMDEEVETPTRSISRRRARGAEGTAPQAHKKAE